MLDLRTHDISLKYWGSVFHSCTSKEDNLIFFLFNITFLTMMTLILGEVCNEDEFQCKNKGQDFDVPDCIDSKHRCDGVPQCADGSDEEKCPKKPEGRLLPLTIKYSPCL